MPAPLIEPLEQRIAPAALWTGGGADANTQTAANWASGIVPGAGDDLTFPAGATSSSVHFNHASNVIFGELLFTGSGYSVDADTAIRSVDGISATAPGTVNILGTLLLAPSGAPAEVNAGTGVTLAIADLSLGVNQGVDFTGAGAIRIGSVTDGGGSGSVTIDEASVQLAGAGWARPTTLVSGSFAHNGTLAGGALTLQGGTLLGGGSAAALTATGGLLRWGDASLTFDGDFTLQSGATLQARFNGSGFAPLSVDGAVALGDSALTMNVAGQIPGRFTLIDNDGSDAVTGTFRGLAEGAVLPIGGENFRISYAGGDGNDVALTRSGALLVPTIVGGKTATFTDADGDLVTVKITKGTLTSANFLAHEIAPGRAVFELLDFRRDAAFDGTNVTITARRTAAGGNGSVDLGTIDAAGIDLGIVSLAGDLAAIDAGDASPTDRAIKSLTVQSLGVRGFATGAADLHSEVNGRIDKLTIRGDVEGVTFVVADRVADAPLGSGAGNATIGALMVNGAILGGAQPESGRIEAHDAILSARVVGGIHGGTGAGSGALVAADQFGKMSVGSVRGGAGADSGVISSLLYSSLMVLGNVVGGDGAGSGSVNAGSGGAVTVNGSVEGGEGAASGVVAVTAGSTIKVRHDVSGGDGVGAGKVVIDTKAKSVMIGGSVRGGAGENSGQVTTPFGTIDSLTIAGLLIGGSGARSASIGSGIVNKIAITGSVIGGSGLASAQIVPAASISIKIGGSVNGIGLDSAVIAPGTAYTLSIGGSLTGDAAGSGVVAGGLTSLILGRDLRGGSGAGSGSVNPAGPVGQLSIGGSIFSGAGALSGAIVSGDSLGVVTISGSIIGTTASPAQISAVGGQDLNGGPIAAIKSLTVKGSVRFANVLAGYAGAVGINADAQIGAVLVGGDWIASSLVAGVVDTLGNGFGNADDAKISAGNAINTAEIDAKIASIVIKGQTLGTSAAGDHFGFIAQEIGALKIGAVSYALTPGRANDDLTATDPGFLIGPTGDFRIREVAL